MAGREHLLTDTELWSLDDLEQLKSGKLVTFLEKTHENLSKHVLKTCRVSFLYPSVCVCLAVCSNTCLRRYVPEKAKCARYVTMHPHEFFPSKSER